MPKYKIMFKGKALTAANPNNNGYGKILSFSNMHYFFFEDIESADAFTNRIKKEIEEIPKDFQNAKHIDDALHAISQFKLCETGITK